MNIFCTWYKFHVSPHPILGGVHSAKPQWKIFATAETLPIIGLMAPDDGTWPILLHEGIELETLEDSLLVTVEVEPCTDVWDGISICLLIDLTLLSPDNCNGNDF